ncbi:hypothetical protein IE077_004068, partial [Cardiosporidium cionae]
MALSTPMGKDGSASIPSLLSNTILYSTKNSSASPHGLNRLGREVLLTPHENDIPPPLPLSSSTSLPSTVNPINALSQSPYNPLLAPLESIAHLLAVQDPLELLDKDRNSSATTGELLEFCSFKEMLEKQQTSTANDLERLNIPQNGDSEARMINRYLALKSFQRSDASKQFKPEETRPLVICRRAIHMILTYFLDADIAFKSFLYRREDNEEYTILDIYNFLRDRLRAIWQDLTVQHGGKHRACIECLEISCRFLILGEGLLCDYPREKFDPVQNSSLMTTCLDKLMSGYKDVSHFLQRTDAMQIRSKNPFLFDILVYQSPHEAEFWAYRILLNIPSENSSGFLDTMATIPSQSWNDPHIRLAITAHQAFHSSNCVRYFKLLKKSKYLMGVLLNKFGNLVRIRSIPALLSSFNRKHGGMKMRLKAFLKQIGCEEEK